MHILRMSRWTTWRRGLFDRYRCLGERRSGWKDRDVERAARGYEAVHARHRQQVPSAQWVENWGVGARVFKCLQPCGTSAARPAPCTVQYIEIRTFHRIGTCRIPGPRGAQEGDIRAQNVFVRATARDRKREVVLQANHDADLYIDVVEVKNPAATSLFLFQPVFDTNSFFLQKSIARSVPVAVLSVDDAYALSSRR